MNALTEITPAGLAKPLDPTYFSANDTFQIEEEVTIYHEGDIAGGYHDMDRDETFGGSFQGSGDIAFVQIGGAQISRDLFIAMVGKATVEGIEADFVQRAQEAVQ